MLHNPNGNTMPDFFKEKKSIKNLAEARKEIFSELASFQWIDVTEELPQLGQRVLLFFNKPSGKSFSNIILGQLVYSNDDQNCFLLDCGEMDSDAVYWMPLPFTP
jgi:hypothetical protein